MAGLERDTAIVAGLAEAQRDEAEFEKGSHGDSHSISGLNDGIHDGLVFPTEEEVATLRRVPDSIPWNAYSQSLISAQENAEYRSDHVPFPPFTQ
jgi:proton-dependent oligopeptide transporter, POT family